MHYRALAICASALTFAAQPACGDDGSQASCPPVPLYDVHDEDVLDPSNPHYRQLRQAAAAGCITYPVPPGSADGGTTP
jgi:hypothetical protein